MKSDEIFTHLLTHLKRWVKEQLFNEIYKMRETIDWNTMQMEHFEK